MGKKPMSRNVMERRKKRRESHSTINNPFEIRINRDKTNVIGRKSKVEKGKPGISRSRAIKKRKRTLLQEYKVKDKANTFLDRRFGEFDEEMPVEEKMLKRFALSRQRRHKKTESYNLDDEELTHFGQSLSNVENMDKSEFLLESGSDAEDGEVATHFGDFQSRSASKEGHEKPKTRKQIVEEIIAQSKKTKYERQQAHDETVQLAEELDAEYRGILGLLSQMKETDDTKPKPKTTDYDILVNELKYQGKAKASERIKSKEEEEEEKNRKLKELEAERIKRMQLPSRVKHNVESADSLGSGREKKEDKRFEIRYRDGKMVLPSGVTSLLDAKNTLEDEYTMHEKSVESANTPSTPTSTNVLETDLAELPKNANELQEILLPHTLEEKPGIIDRMLKRCQNEEEQFQKRHNMENFFEILLDYIDLVCEKPSPPLEFINKLASTLFDLAIACPRYATSTLQTRLRKCIKRFTRRSEMSGNKVLLPSLKEILLLKIIATLYPTSDVRHHVTTPALTLMGAMLLKSFFRTVKDIAVGLMLSALIYDFVALSKRYVPEVMQFLTGVVWLSVKKEANEIPQLKCKKTEQNLLYFDEKTEQSGDMTVSSIIFSSEAFECVTARICCLKACLKLLIRFSLLYEDLPSHSDIFATCHRYLERLNISLYPDDLQNLVQSVEGEICKNVERQRLPLTWLARKPVPLPLLEPVFMETYEVQYARRGGKGKGNERQKLRYKYKKEFKGAVREIRKDAQFLAKEQLREKIERDQERTRKVNELMRDLSQQQSDCNNLTKVKKKASR